MTLCAVILIRPETVQKVTRGRIQAVGKTLRIWVLSQLNLSKNTQNKLDLIALNDCFLCGSNTQFGPNVYLIDIWCMSRKKKMLEWFRGLVDTTSLQYLCGNDGMCSL